MTLGILLGLLAAAVTSGGDGLRAISRADRVIAIHRQDWGLGSASTPALILVAWPDGRVVWSEDRVRGGPPYWAGRVPPARVADAFARMERDGVFGDKRLSQACVGPDAEFTTILVRDGGRDLKMDSWHEVAEARGGVVARSCGLAGLDGARRLELVRKEPADYLYYRVVWGELRALAASLIPAESRRDGGELVMKAGIMSWREAVRE